MTNIIFAVCAAIAIVMFGVTLRRNLVLQSLNQDLVKENSDLNKAVTGLKLRLRTRVSQYDKRVQRLERINAQLSQELRDEQENSLQLAANTTQLEVQLTQAHALLHMVLEEPEAAELRKKAPLSRHKLRAVFCV